MGLMRWVVDEEGGGREVGQVERGKRRLWRRGIARLSCCGGIEFCNDEKLPGLSIRRLLFQVGFATKGGTELRGTYSPCNAICRSAPDWTGQRASGNDGRESSGLAS